MQYVKCRTVLDLARELLGGKYKSDAPLSVGHEGIWEEHDGIDVWIDGSKVVLSPGDKSDDGGNL